MGDPFQMIRTYTCRSAAQMVGLQPLGSRATHHFPQDTVSKTGTASDVDDAVTASVLRGAPFPAFVTNGELVG